MASATAEEPEDESTLIEAEEAHRQRQSAGEELSYEQEVDLLRQEGEMSLEELRAMYYGSRGAGGSGSVSDDDGEEEEASDDDKMSEEEESDGDKMSVDSNGIIGHVEQSTGIAATSKNVKRQDADSANAALAITANNSDDAFKRLERAEETAKNYQVRGALSDWRVPFMF